MILAATGCEIAKEKKGDFDLSCSRWDSSVTLCENYIETKPLTGYLKIWYFEDDPYYGTNLFLCGADLELNTGHPFEDFAAGRATKGELLCSDATQDDVDWSWDTETHLSAKWDNLYLEIEVPYCQYDDKICVIEGYGYISVE